MSFRQEKIDISNFPFRHEIISIARMILLRYTTESIHLNTHDSTTHEAFVKKFSSKEDSGLSA
jgi:hypothetical protein